MIPNKLQVQCRLSQEMLAAAGSLGIPVMGGLRLRRAFADAAGQGSSVWRLDRRGQAAASELESLFKEVIGHETDAKPE